MTAISFHFLLALPDGRLHDSVRRVVAVGGYLVAVAVGLVFVLDHRPFSPGRRRGQLDHRRRAGDRARASRYIGSIGYHRERMEWFGIGVTLAATVALVATVLHLLVGWPGPLGAVAAGATVLVPLGLLVGENRRMAPHASRGLVQVLAVFGFVVVVSAIYLVVVLGLGHAPKTTGDKEVLALSMVASGVAALIFVPVRGAVPRLRHQVRLRVTGGPRRGAADLRQPAHPRHPHGRAAAAAGRVAPQDDEPHQRRGLHRNG